MLAVIFPALQNLKLLILKYYEKILDSRFRMKIVRIPVYQDPFFDFCSIEIRIAHIIVKDKYQDFR